MKIIKVMKYIIGYKIKDYKIKVMKYILSPNNEIHRNITIIISTLSRVSHFHCLFFHSSYSFHSVIA